MQGIKLGKGGEYSIEGNGKACEVFANAIKAAKTISVGNNFYFDADGEFKFDKDGNIIANSVTAGKLASKGLQRYLFRQRVCHCRKGQRERDINFASMR